MSKFIKIRNIALLTVTLAGGMLFFQQDASAKVIGKVNNEQFESFGKLASKVGSQADKTVTVDMLEDWVGTDRLQIPSGSHVTLNMNGHKFDRNKDAKDWESDGEVIYINKNATLTINGGDTSVTHTKAVYDKEDKSYHRSNKEFKGGLITGGNSTNGAGGIHMLESATLVLNEVNIAGNHAEQRMFSSGHGGAIYASGKNITVTMNHSYIAYNYAYNDGGAIYQNASGFTLNMNKESKIDHNVANGDGGGIYADSSDFSVYGDGTGYISGNHSDKNGGGVYFDEKNQFLSGVIMNSNISNKNGGAVYFNSESESLTNCQIVDNVAHKYGGGTYVSDKGATHSGCIIMQNTANIEGGGIYLNAKNASFKGRMNITDNVAKENSQTANLYGYLTFSSSYEMKFGLTKGSKIDLNVDSSSDKITLSSGSYVNDKLFTSTRPNSYVDFDTASYALYLIKGTKSETEVIKEQAERYSTVKKKTLEVETVDEIIGKTNRIYDVVKGYYEYPSELDDQKDNIAEFYYSDGYFDAASTQYNPHLATWSMNLAMSGFYLNTGANVDYEKKHASYRQMLSNIGFDKQQIYVNEYNTKKPEATSIGVSIANKKLQYSDANGETHDTGYYIVPVSIRGANYAAEWASNVTLGSGKENGGEALGFSTAAGIVYDEVEKYIDNYGLRSAVNDKKVKFLVVGFSRAGATANLTSRRLVDKYGSKQVYGYDFAAPQGGTMRALSDNGKSYTDYKSIHNIVNYCDIVPQVGPTRMGFMRYGVDHFAPGLDMLPEIRTKVTSEGISGGYNEDGVKDDTVASMQDNDYLILTDKNSAVYNEKVDKMKKQLRAVEPALDWDDHFVEHTINYIPSVDIVKSEKYYKGGTKDIARFERDFLQKLQEWCISSRDNYAKNPLVLSTWTNEYKGTTYCTTQEAVATLIGIVMAMDSADLSYITDRAALITSSMDTLLGEYSLVALYNSVINGYNLNDYTKEKWAKYFWDKCEELKVFARLSQSDKQKLKDCFPVLISFAFEMLSNDYRNYEQNMVGTFAANATMIMQNHYPERYLAWVRSEDDYYDDACPTYETYKENAITPELTAKTKEVLSEPTIIKANTEISLAGNKTILLDAENVKGEIIYYTLKNLETGSETKRQIYSGGVDLSLKNENRTRYCLKATAYSYDKSSSYEYYITIRSDVHSVDTLTLDPGKMTSPTDSDANAFVTTTKEYHEGDKVVITASDNKYRYFKYWTVKEKYTGKDVSAMLTDAQKKDSSLEFEMPSGAKMKQYGLEDNYGLVFKPVYGIPVVNGELRITDESAERFFVEAGEQLPQSLEVVWNAKDDNSNTVTEKKLNIQSLQWSYTAGEDPTEYASSSGAVAYLNSKYTVKFVIKNNKENGLVFYPDVKLANMSDKWETQAVRNEVDPETGDLYVQWTYGTKTAEQKEGAPSVPNQTQMIQLATVDVNTGQTLSTFTYQAVAGDVITFIPPSEEDEEFSLWNQKTIKELNTKYGADTITINDGSDNLALTLKVPELSGFPMTLQADYVPVVNEFEITMDAPKAREVLPDKLSKVRVKVTGEFYLDPDAFQIEWQPSLQEGAIAEYDTYYTATIALKDSAKTDGIKVYDKDGNKLSMVDGSWAVTEDEASQMRIAAKFIFSDDYNIKVNDENAFYDEYEESIIHFFDETQEAPLPDIVEVVAPEIIKDVPYGTSIKDIYDKLLPKTVDVIVTDKSITHVGVNWDATPEITSNNDKDKYAEVHYLFRGNIVVPGDVATPTDTNITKVSVEVAVNAADRTEAPVTLTREGEYNKEIKVYLQAEEGAKIYYTLDGKTPSTESKVYQDGIVIRDENMESGDYYLSAIAVKDGKRVSEIATFHYSFTRNVVVPDDVKVNYANGEQILLYASDLYTITLDENSKAHLDADGNVVATQVGTYNATLKLVDGYKWHVKTGEFDKETEQPIYETSEENQIVHLTIDKAKSKVILEDDEQQYTGTALSIKPAIVEGSTGKVIYHYYRDSQCTEEIKATEVISCGTYYVKAVVEADASYASEESKPACFIVRKITPSIFVADKIAKYTGKPVAINPAVVEGSTGKVTYHYYKDEACTKEISADAVVANGTYYVKAVVEETNYYGEAESEVATLVIDENAEPEKDATEITLDNITYAYTGVPVCYGVVDTTGFKDVVRLVYYSDKDATNKLVPTAVIKPGVYYVQAIIIGEDAEAEVISNTAMITITKAESSIILSDKSAQYTGKPVAIDPAEVEGSTGRVTYHYYKDKACTLEILPSQVVASGVYYVKAVVEEDDCYKAAESKAVILTILKDANGGNNTSTQPEKPVLADQKITLKKKVIVIKQKLLKKKGKYTKKILIKGAKTALQFKKVKGSSKFKITKNGNLVVKKNTKKKTYKITIKVTAKGTKDYKKVVKKFVLKVKVK